MKGVPFVRDIVTPGDGGVCMAAIARLYLAYSRRSDRGDGAKSSLRTADAFSVVASLPPKNSYYFRRERSDDR